MAERLEVAALRAGGPPFFAPRWRADEVGMTIDAGADWKEVAELVSDSYCLLAPQKLVKLVHRPAS